MSLDDDFGEVASAWRTRVKIAMLFVIAVRLRAAAFAFLLITSRLRDTVSRLRAIMSSVLRWLVNQASVAGRQRIAQARAPRQDVSNYARASLPSQVMPIKWLSIAGLGDTPLIKPSDHSDVAVLRGWSGLSRQGFANGLCVARPQRDH